MTRDAPPEVLTSRLGYLLKHAYLRLTEESSLALAPYGIDGRELAVLAVLDAHDELSQLDAAGKLGIDRTTMVSLVDALEDKELVERRRSPRDRRKNIVQLTPASTKSACRKPNRPARKWNAASSPHSPAQTPRAWSAPCSPSSAPRWALPGA